MIDIGSRIRDGYDTTTDRGPVRVFQFPGGVGRLHTRHAAIVVAALLVRDTEDVWDAPVLPAPPAEPLQLTAGEPLDAA